MADHWGSVGGDWSHIGDSRNRCHRMSGIAGDWESRVGVGRDNWRKWCLVGHRVVDQGPASSVGGGNDSRVEKSWVSFSLTFVDNMSSSGLVHERVVVSM